MYLSPVVFLSEQTAQAAPIVDLRAPISFQPTTTATSRGTPTVNIAAPNSNGISLNQYQTSGVCPEGLALNNSTVPGTPLLGGALGANSNLSGRPASTIINRVTSNNAAVMNRPLETFGVPATVIVSAPGDVSVNGIAPTNIPGLTSSSAALLRTVA
ncbi:filamentous hemagglutinin N-terminal domain-containing protein [Burkholderia sp. Ac-20345]|uniref:two-partner secretion domain-containing protein n=1 Tax=Burkholderia sp. Ac-20345 TaxID=2703891 RepID=UPI00197BBACF|nr:hypothetical protein [Burkholderia sp. Ac-20345]MBN3776639.1 filamentous hemagglutinin N-terminal domain-containing protein [Burkholderia sp. Ac-20345]